MTVKHSLLEKISNESAVIGIYGLGYVGLPLAIRFVEAGFRDFHVTPSQGTHFFQNLISNNVGYFTVNPEEGDGTLDWGWLAAQPAVSADGSVRHTRL